jgi:hypothetical protein
LHSKFTDVEQLKPKCIELSQLALRDDGSIGHSKALLKSTTDLLSLLERSCRRSDGVFDEKLADYVFFPLSQILRRKQKYTDLLSEVSIKCLRILLEYGWKNSIALDLAKQLLILLTFVAGGVPGREATTRPEEVVIEAFGGLAALFKDLTVTPGGAAALIEPGTVPALGHTVTVVLDGVTNGPSAEAQIQALQTLDALWHCIKDPQALSNFLPGTVSGLTKCLMPATGSRRTRKTLVKALEILSYVLVSVLSDVRTRSIRNEPSSAIIASTTTADQKPPTNSWLKASAGQIKLALSNVIRLRSHESAEVRKALNRLCITLLDECHESLAGAASILVETCMTLTGIDDDEGGGLFSKRSTTLIDLASIYPDLTELIKSTIFNWVTSLPRIMQANDDGVKLVALEQLSKAQDLLVGLNLQSSILEDALGNSLRDSITVTLEAPSQNKALQEADFDLNSQSALMLTTDNSLSTQFSPIVMARESQKNIRDQLTILLSSLGTRQSQLNMASEMLEYARGASGPSILSAYWLSSQILRSAAAKNQDVDEFLESSLTLSDEQEIMNQELFSFSQSLLVETDERTSDWRLQAIALEVVADAAQRMKEEFRTELIDTLYPVAQLLGSPNSRLREHAITCLNIISNSCGYTSASQLIVDNVDYMVNAISLRLNTFDISPQAPQVLVMMIRLTGPSLLPYLDDVVGSIFAALDNFHGYHRLVDVLFSVLSEIVSVGAQSSQLQVENTSSLSHKKKAHPIPTINDILALLSPKTNPKDKDEDFPHTPWKSAQTLLDEANPDSSLLDDDEETPPPPAPPQELTSPPQSKTHKMLTSIALLSQHYLTSSSPLLRSKLLALIRISSLGLANHEDSFLPLINEIWPVLIARIYDSESYVQIAACEAVSEICKGGGDFLGTRIRDEWGAVITLARRAKSEMEREQKARRGVYAQSSQVWEGIVSLLVTIVGYVRIDEDMFDDVVDVLGELVWERAEIKEVLEVINADTVWLAMQVAGKNGRLERPVMEGFEFFALENGIAV